MDSNRKDLGKLIHKYFRIINLKFMFICGSDNKAYTINPGFVFATFINLCVCFPLLALGLECEI